jgi:hypothetical protein
MANLKLDLINKINNDKYFEELELVRLAQDPNMNYREKVELMTDSLAEIALLDAQLSLVEKYFQEPAQAAPAVQQAPAGQVFNGQSHGE